MFRVDKEFGEQRTRLTVSGEISSACIEVLVTSCEQAIKDGKAVHLVLNVTTIDESGRALLRRLAGKGVRLIDVIWADRRCGFGAIRDLERSVPLTR